MKRIENFVKNTFKHVPKDRQKEIIPLITDALTEKVEDLVEKGKTLDEAIDQAVMEFGSASDYFDDYEKVVRKVKRQKTLSHYKNDLLFAGVGSAIIIGMLIFSNLYYTPDLIWFVLPTLAVLWWPAAILYNLLNKRANQKRGNKDE